MEQQFLPTVGMYNLFYTGENVAYILLMFKLRVYI